MSNDWGSNRTVYLQSGGQRLFTRFHAPARRGPSDTAVLICPPWGPDEVASYRPCRAWADLLAASGHPVLRFDLPATGNSSGSPSDDRLVEAWLEAISTAAAWLGAESGHSVAALGLGLGGLLATEAISSGAQIEEMALWGAPKSGSAFVTEIKRFARLQSWGIDDDGESAPEGSLEVDGQLLSRETLAELEALGECELHRAPRRALVISRDSGQAPSSLAARLAEAGAEIQEDSGGRWGSFVSHPTKARLPEEIAAAVGRWLSAGSPQPTVGTDSKSAELGETVELEIDGRQVLERSLSIETQFGDLFGILAMPAEEPASDVCGVFLNAGALRTIGPNRLWTERARAWAAEGVPSLRLDFADIGEGGGDPSGIPPGADYFSPRFQAQVAAALEALADLGLGRRILLAGLCSGGYHGLRTALLDERVVSVVMINPSVIVWRPGFFEEQEMHANVSYLGEGKRLKKLLRGEIGAKRILEYAGTVTRGGHQAIARLIERRGQRQLDWRRQLTEELNELGRRGATVTIAFSAAEPTAEEIQRAGFRERLEALDNVQLETLPGNDHTVRPLTAQRGVAELLDAKLQAVVPARLSAPAS